MIETLLHDGRDALKRSDWLSAQTRYRQAVALEPASVDALEGLATSSWWLSDEPTVFSCREAVYRIYLEKADLPSAARTAVWLAIDTLDFRGQPAVANGWLQRARRHLQGFDLQPEHALVLLCEGQMELMLRNDPDSALRLGDEAASCARRLGQRDLEGMAIALQGLAYVTAGDIKRGIALLDEAGITASSEVAQPEVALTIICYIVDGCGRVRDFDRASQWCAQMEEFSQRIRVTEVSALCRPHYATLLMWRGAWAEAESQLQRGIRDMSRIRPLMAVESSVKLADLRVRQGRYDEARALLEPVKNDGLALLPAAELALATGEAKEAAGLAERRLRQLPEHDVVERLQPLELLVRAYAESGDRASLGKAVSELETSASRIGTPVVRAAALLAKGLMASESGDLAAARDYLERAVDTYEKSRSVYEAARARLELADVLLESGLTPKAAGEARMALNTLRDVGAAGEASRAEAMLLKLSDAVMPQPDALAAISAGTVLTTREIEILRELAAGKSNTEIAAKLVLSVRTVERHVTNIYTKLGLAGKTARAAATAYAFTRGYAGHSA